MPRGIVKTKADEKKWNRAKKQVEKQYGSVKGRYGLVTTIFKNMKKKRKKRK